MAAERPRAALQRGPHGQHHHLLGERRRLRGRGLRRRPGPGGAEVTRGAPTRPGQTREAGLTLVEVVIAVAILAIGVLAVFALQGNALRGTRGAVLSQQMAKLAQSELQLQREFSRYVSAPVRGESCRSGLPSDAFACTVDVLPCEMSGADIACRDASVTDAVARQVDVVIT